MACVQLLFALCFSSTFNDFTSPSSNPEIESDGGFVGDADPEISTCSFIYCPILSWSDLPSLGLLTNVQMPLSLFSPDSSYFVAKKDFSLCSVLLVFLLGLLWFLHPAAVVLRVSDPREMLYFPQTCNLPWEGQGEKGVRWGGENRMGLYCETVKSAVFWALYNLGKALADILRSCPSDEGTWRNLPKASWCFWAAVHLVQMKLISDLFTDLCLFEKLVGSIFQQKLSLSIYNNTTLRLV